MSVNRPDSDLLLEHAEFLRALARGLLGDPHHADDVVQETFAVAVDRPPRHRGNLRSWLATVTRRLALRVRRDGGRRGRRERRAARPDRLPSAAMLAARAEVSRNLLAALDELPEVYRVTIHYRYFDGLGPGEISERTGIPVKTVKTRLHRGLAMLRARLDEKHEGRRNWTSVLLPVAATGRVTKMLILVTSLILLATGFVVVEMREDPAPPAAPPPAELDVAQVVPAPDPLPEPAAAGEDADPPATRPDSGRWWRVTVLGPGEQPVGGVRIHRRDRAADPVATGADGVAVLPWEPVDGKLSVFTSGVVPRINTVLKRPERTIRFPDLIPLTAEVRDGETGYPLPGASVRVRVDSGATLDVPAEGDGFRLPLSPIVKGRKASLTFTIGPPEGYALAKPGTESVSATVSRFTESAHATFAVWREAKLRVRVSEADGRPAVGARVLSVWGSLGSVTFKAGPTDSSGETVVRGVPCLRGERIRVSAGKDGRASSSEPAFLVHSSEEVLREVVLPEVAPSEASTNMVIGIGGGAGGSFGGRGGHRILTQNMSKLTVRVLRRNGAPARDALVIVGYEKQRGASARTDREGVARFHSLPPGRAGIRVREPGFRMGPQLLIQLLAGETGEIEIREASGTFHHVSVLDDRGLPVPFAHLEVKASGEVPFVHLVDGVQRLNLFTDRDGRAVLPDVPEGKVKVTARFGSREKSAEGGFEGLMELWLPPAR